MSVHICSLTLPAVKISKDRRYTTAFHYPHLQITAHFRALHLPQENTIQPRILRLTRISTTRFLHNFCHDWHNKITKIVDKNKSFRICPEGLQSPQNLNIAASPSGFMNHSADLEERCPSRREANLELESESFALGLGDMGLHFCVVLLWRFLFQRGLVLLFGEVLEERGEKRF